GSTRDEAVDVWIVTATNEDLRTAVRERRFRADLYHRLAVLPLALPPLRERGADIGALADHFLQAACADYGVPPKTLTSAAHAAVGRPARPTPAGQGALRWERRRVTLLRATLTLAPESDEPLGASRALGVLVEKVTSFGGRIEGMSPTGVVAAFGLDATEDAPSRAAHAAMAIQKAAARARPEDPRAPAVTVGIHLAQCLVGHAPHVTELAIEAKQKAVEVLSALVERGEPGSVLVTEAAAPFLERRFELLDFAG